MNLWTLLLGILLAQVRDGRENIIDTNALSSVISGARDSKFWLVREDGVIDIDRTTLGTSS